MPDDSPQGFITRPGIAVRRYGRLPLFLAGGALLLVLLVLIWSVETSTERQDRSQAEMKEPVGAAPAPQKPLVPEADQSQGLAQPEPEKTAPTMPLISIVPAPKPSREYVARKNDIEELHRKRKQALEKALVGDVRVNTSIPHRGANVPPAVGPNVAQTARQARVAEIQGQSGESVAGDPSVTGGSGDDTIDKEAFLAERGRTDSQWTLTSRRTPGQPFELKTGSVIPGMLVTGINSDLPGQIVAQITRDILDTATAEYVLIPQGSKFYGIYDSRVAMGQSRLLAAFNRILFPDGSSIDLGAMPAADMAGLAGFRGDVNNHYLRIFGNAAVMSLISGGMAYGLDSMKGTGGQEGSPTVQDEMGTALASQLGQASLQLLQRNMQIKPELTINPGYRFNLVVTKDIVFDEPYRDWRHGKPRK